MMPGQQNIEFIQGYQKVSVHLMIAAQKHAKIFKKISVTYRDNVVRNRGNRWRWCESSVPLALATGCQTVRLNQVVSQERCFVIMVLSLGAQRLSDHPVLGYSRRNESTSLNTLFCICKTLDVNT
jgi:hypothetical protein